VSTFKNDKTYVVFEDLTKNEEAITEKEVKKNTKTALNSTKRNSIYLITINEKGEFTKELLYDYKDMFINPKISASKEIKPGEILFNAYDIIGKLEIN
jgi:16S rRNA C1402 (ribose-2'-O) methylase RsmI